MRLAIMRLDAAAIILHRVLLLFRVVMRGVKAGIS